MNLKLYLLLLSVSASFTLNGQSFVYDQQSSDDSHVFEGTVGLGLQPLGQSFTPTFDSVGFVRLFLSSSGLGGGSFTVNIRDTSMTGTILDSATTVSLPSGFSGIVDFLFATPISLSPSATYYLQPVVQSGGGWSVNASSYNYSGGTAYVNGSPISASDLWFREGIVVPEPSSLSLIALSTGILLVMRGRRNKK